MTTCPKCGKEIPEGTQTCPACGSLISERAARGIPNIPRRPPDPLPERPGKGASSGTQINLKMILMLIAAAAVIAFIVLYLK